MLSPARRGVVVLDEVHWAADPGARFGLDARPVAARARTSCTWPAPRTRSPCCAAAYGERLEVVWTERLTGPLDAGRRRGHRAAGARHGGGGVLARRGDRARVADPRRARRQRRRALRRDAGCGTPRPGGASSRAARTEVLVSTDVLGHGVNLPCRTVLFAETTKFDGVERRDLLGWEVAQIAGRAGRFGLHEDGLGRLADGARRGCGRTGGWSRGAWSRWRASVRAGRSPAYRRLSRAQLGPARADLADRAAAPLAGRAGGLVAGRACCGARRGLAAHGTGRADPGPAPRWSGLQRLRRLPPDDAWSIALAPVDAGDQGRAARRASQRRCSPATRSRTSWTVRGGGGLRDRGRRGAVGARAAVLRWFTRRHPGVGGISAGQADALEAAASARVIELVPVTIEGAGAGRCEVCGREAAPWFSRCDACQAGGGARSAAAPTTSSSTRAPSTRASSTRAPKPPPNRAERRRRARRS